MQPAKCSRLQYSVFMIISQNCCCTSDKDKDSSGIMDHEMLHILFHIERAKMTADGAPLNL
jgi:hypothetical protein